ncbi:DUF6343 family protein [Cryptosporangium aurantiacum]|uniref:Uncharacterized protein n=1 Tax=Cryptosporangium aurantiacum TaxID=134849 RepID=A0A1M7N448_9ACTN|nr:DUF6343 family protein [Cryptosporangium aurantiacum]SHM98308.1 hypothetical protein SAMN05443668_102410 [Cryptosporangium aurantiacum]
MPLSAQPPGRRGTVGHPYSPLNLRLALAVFGFVASAVLAALLFAAGQPVPGWVAVALAAVALVDAVVVQLRRRARHRTDPSHHSFFE